MDPLKDVAGGILLLFLLLGAVDLIVIGALVTISSVVQGVFAVAAIGSIMLLIGLGLAVMLWRQ